MRVRREATRTRDDEDAVNDDGVCDWWWFVLIVVIGIWFVWLGNICLMLRCCFWSCMIMDLFRRWICISCGITARCRSAIGICIRLIFVVMFWNCLRLVWMSWWKCWVICFCVWWCVWGIVGRNKIWLSRRLGFRGGRALLEICIGWVYCCECCLIEWVFISLVWVCDMCVWLVCKMNCWRIISIKTVVRDRTVYLSIWKSRLIWCVMLLWCMNKMVLSFI